MAVALRGGVPFVDKARRAQAVGSVAMVIINNRVTPPAHSNHDYAQFIVVFLDEGFHKI